MYAIGQQFIPLIPKLEPKSTRLPRRESENEWDGLEFDTQASEAVVHPSLTLRVTIGCEKLQLGRVRILAAENLIAGFAHRLNLDCLH